MMRGTPSNDESSSWRCRLGVSPYQVKVFMGTLHIPKTLVFALATRGLVACGLAVSQANAEAAVDRVVATVDGGPITQAEVAFFVPNTSDLTELSDSVRKSAIRIAIDRRLVIAALTRRKRGISDAKLEQKIADLKSDLGRREVGWERFLSDQNLNEEALRHVLRWQHIWTDYVANAITDDNLKRYFQTHRREFDGTRLRVAHILWKSPKKIDEATRVAKQIQAGNIDFREAAAQYSSAPTASQGGEIGWIERHQPMAPSFSEVAFGLGPNEVSLPVRTPAGIHVIRCIEEQRGSKTWREVQPELESAVQRYLFGWLADQQRPLSKVVVGKPSE